jgi:hypothetical protein
MKKMFVKLIKISVNIEVDRGFKVFYNRRYFLNYFWFAFWQMEQASDKLEITLDLHCIHFMLFMPYSLNNDNVLKEWRMLPWP